MPEVLTRDGPTHKGPCISSGGMQRLSCKECGKTLMFFKPSRTKRVDCVTVEIKCRNRECRAINEIKLCHRICGD